MRQAVELAALSALEEGLIPVAVIAEFSGASRQTVYRWAKLVRSRDRARFAYRQLWEVHMSKVGGSWMLAGRPKSADERLKRGLQGRRLSPQEIQAEAAKRGLPVAQTLTKTKP